jgi:uncharacterized peroxidase-related enzyme
MSYFPDAPPDARAAAVFEQIQAAFGFVPNFFKAQTLRSDLIESEVGLMGAILLTEGALTRREKEYLFLVCSAANLSTYCVTAHCEIVRILGIEGPEPEQVALDPASTGLPMATKALLAFALKLNNHPSRLAAADVEALRTYGYSDQQILETVVVVGFAKFANYVAFGLGTLPDFEPRVDLVGTHSSAAGVR